MVRMQIQFTEEQADYLRRRARERGTSIAAVVRQAVDERDEPDEGVDALARFRAALRKPAGRGPADLSARHDEYLAEDPRVEHGLR